MDWSPTASSVHGILQAKILKWVAITFSRGSSDPGIEPGSPALQADSLASKPPRASIMVYYSDIKLFAETWMDLEFVILSEF